MRAVQVADTGGPETLELVDMDAPDPGPGEVRVDVAAAGVNFADVEKRRGRYPGAPEPPYVPGIEVAGEVDATGPGGDRAVGERVAAIPASGGYAERVVVPAERLFPVPDELSDAEAAGYPVQGLTAHNALVEWGALAAGERVLVHAAAGGVGSAAVQLASAAGAEVFGTASTDEKLAFATELGCDHPIDYEREDVADRIDALTDGEGVDLVLDGVGGDAFYAGVDALADAGRIVTYGMASGDVPTVATPRLFFENKSVRGYHLGHALEHVPERVRAAVPSLTGALADGDLAVQVGETFSLADAADAHAHLQSRASVGAVVLEP